MKETKIEKTEEEKHPLRRVELVSRCCSYPVKVVFGKDKDLRVREGEGTAYYVCTKCKKACDAKNG